MDVSIVICTHERTQLLWQALSSCLMQKISVPVQAEVIVVDNSQLSTARDVVTRSSEDAALSVRYVCEPRPNTALARNAGVARSRAEFIAFLDDDEQASQQWLQELIVVARTSNADAVFGPILPRFEDGRPPPWDPEGRYYTRDLRLANGAPIARTSMPVGNCLIRRQTCVLENAPFDSAFGRTGGEDSDLFYRLAKLDRRFVWASEAVVWEFQPSSRTTLHSMCRRKFQLNQTHVRYRVKNDHGRRWWTAGQLMLRGAVQAAVWLVPAASPTWAKPRLQVASGLGKVLWMFPNLGRLRLGGAEHS